MLRPIFNYFITQADGTIIGDALNPQSYEHLVYVISPDGNVAERQDAASHDLCFEDASYVRYIAGQSYHRAANYATRQKLF